MTAADPAAAPAAAAPIDCEAAVRRLWDYLDGRLSPAAHDEVEAHLATCVLCPPHFDFSRRMQHALADAGGPAPDGAAAAALHARVAAALRAAAGAPGGSGGPDG